MGAERTTIVETVLGGSNPSQVGEGGAQREHLHLIDRETVSMLDLDQETLDDNYTYRWVHASPAKVTRAKAKRYTLVTADEGVKNSQGEDLEANEQGLIQVSDVVLMKCPKDRFLGRKAAQEELTASRLSSPKKAFKREAKKARPGGVEVITKKDVRGSS